MADSELTSGCSIISQKIWIEIFIALAILGRGITIEKLSAGKSSMDIHITRCHTFDFGSMSFLMITGWHRWRTWQMWSRFWCRLAGSLRWRCTCGFAPPLYLGILWCATLAWEAAVRLIFSKHSRVSLHRSHRILCPGNSTPHFFSSRTLVRGFLIRNCVSSIASHEYPPLAILAIFKPRRMTDCYSCTRPPCLAIVVDMLKTYKTLVAGSTWQIRLVPLPYTLP